MQRRSRLDGAAGSFNKEREEMIADIILILCVMFLGGVLGLIAEFLKYLYPIYLALVFLLAAQLLTLLGRMMKVTVKEGSYGRP